MPTNKHRINLSVPASLDRILQKLARRDETSVSSKALQLIERAIEIEEDAALLAIAKKRDRKKYGTVSHDKAWR